MSDTGSFILLRASRKRKRIPRFFQLPKNVRSLIYQYAIVNLHVSYSACHDSKYQVAIRHDDPTDTDLPRWIMASKRVMAEALSEIHRGCEVRVYNYHKPMGRWLDGWASNLIRPDKITTYGAR